MEISVEISFYPLIDEYEPPIQDFIRAVRSSGLRYQETPLSTLVFGEYEGVMEFLTREISASLSTVPVGLFHLKIASGNRGEYEPDF